MRTTGKLGPWVGLVAASDWLHRVRDGTFTPTPVLHVSPILGTVPGWALANQGQGWGGGNERGTAGQEATRSWRARPGDGAARAMPRSMMDPRAGPPWVPSLPALPFTSPWASLRLLNRNPTIALRPCKDEITKRHLTLNLQPSPT